MATAAQIEANRRNAQRSTGPKTDEGKARARCNALRHGMAALTIVPALPQENPKRLEELTQEWDSDVQPQNAIERDLVRKAARLSLAIDRGEWIETQMLGAWRRAQIRELGRRLRPPDLWDSVVEPSSGFGLRRRASRQVAGWCQDR